MDASATINNLTPLFRPGSIALVGATDKSGWSWSTFQNLRSNGFEGELYLVNSTSKLVHGETTYASISELPISVDLVYVMVPTTAVLPVLREAWAAGTTAAVVLTAGFAEAGPEGQRIEETIAEFAHSTGMLILGPNCNGYLDASRNITPYGLPLPNPLIKGGVGVALQSGALAGAILNLAQARNVGISFLAVMGNEAVVTIEDVIDYLIDDPATTTVVLFLETLRHPARFVEIARKALLKKKPIIALKIGRSEVGARVALAHTGSLVGDHSVTDAAFASLGVIRVHSLEDLVTTAGLLDAVGPIDGRRIGVVTPSGGAAEIIADRAEDEGLSLPGLSTETVKQLKEILPSYATAQNPLDVTGYFVVDRSLVYRSLDIMVNDPGIDLGIVTVNDFRVPVGDPEAMIGQLSGTALVASKADVPVVAMNYSHTDVTTFGRDLQERTGIAFALGGIEHGLKAIGQACWWTETSQRLRRAEPAPAAKIDLSTLGDTSGVWAEAAASKLLANAGVPMIPSVLADDIYTARLAAEQHGYPVVMKIGSNEITHKSDLGGVRVGIDNDEDLEVAFDELVQIQRQAGVHSPIVLVQPYRSEPAVEILVSVVRDPEWGLMLTVGLGGIWVEVLRDAQQLMLPVSQEQILEALSHLKASSLLDGARGGITTDRNLVAQTIAKIAAVAAALGDRLSVLEINPLQARGETVEGLDALIVWAEDARAGGGAHVA